MIKKSVTLLVLALTFSPGLLYAGAEATVNACVYFPVKPDSPMTVTFTPKKVHCMYKGGSRKELIVKKEGVSCADIGTVEGKSSSSGGDLCATADSIWDLSYTISDSAYSGTTSSKWSHPILSHQHITLVNYSKGTVVCPSDSLCVTTKQDWGSTKVGKVYIIFKPSSVDAEPGQSANEEPDSKEQPAE